MTACTGQTTKSSHQTVKVLLKALAKSNSSKLVVTFFKIVVRRSTRQKIGSFALLCLRTYLSIIYQLRGQKNTIALKNDGLTPNKGFSWPKSEVL